MTRALGFATVSSVFGGLLALLLSHLTYILGWHDDMQLAALYAFGYLVGATASDLLAITARYLLTLLEH